jgi:hypothetical protein
MRMRADRLRDRFGWGVALWLVGYVLGIALYFVVPPSMIGWVLIPVGTLLTTAVLWTRVRARALEDFALIAVVWTAIAIAGDYLFIVRLLDPPDGYYKADVYLYYALTFVLPLLIGSRRIGIPS